MIACRAFKHLPSPQRVRLTESLCSNTSVLATSVAGLLECVASETAEVLRLHRVAVQQHVYLLYLLAGQLGEQAAAQGAALALEAKGTRQEA